MRLAGIRPTPQRLALVRLLETLGPAHVTADEVFRLAGERGIRLSLGTVYNTLRDFAGVGLLRRIDLGERNFFCTDPKPHHHYLDETTGRLSAIPDPQPMLLPLPAPPPGTEIAGIEVVVRLRAGICPEQK
ncbi:MAG: transcriptional repressor [Rhodospirillales bacterium]|nr:transcriptional repressor [Rhodospirillales bacterium]